MPFLTPDTSAETWTVVSFVPEKMMPLFLGALSELLELSNWEFFGELTISEAMEIAEEMISTVTENPSEIFGETTVYRAFLYAVDSGNVTFLLGLDGSSLIILLSLG